MFLTLYANPAQSLALTIEDEIFLTLVRLRLAFSVKTWPTDLTSQLQQYMESSKVARHYVSLVAGVVACQIKTSDNRVASSITRYTLKCRNASC